MTWEGGYKLGKRYYPNTLISSVWYLIKVSSSFQGLTLKEKVIPLKFKEKSSDEAPSYKNLLLWMVRLIHADPMLMLNVSLV